MINLTIEEEGYMDIGEIVKNITPYVVSIIGSFWAYMQAKKKMNQELEIVKTNNEYEINRLIEEHKINIERGFREKT